jgi:hypothetical protein
MMRGSLSQQETYMFGLQLVGLMRVKLLDLLAQQDLKEQLVTQAHKVLLVLLERKVLQV